MRHLSIRQQLLIGAFVLGTFPLLILSLLLPPSVEKTLLSSGEDNLVRTARSLSRLVQHMLSQHVETLGAIGNSEFLNQQLTIRNHGTVTPENIDGVNRRLKGFMNAFTIPYEAVFVSDAAGITFAGLTKQGDPTPFIHLTISDRDYFNQSRQSLQPQITGPMISKVSGQPVVVIAYPLKDSEGNFAGLLGLSLNADYLSTLIVDQGLSSKVTVFAIDRSGMLAAHADPGQILGPSIAKLKESERLATRMCAGETGLEHYGAEGREHRVAAFAPVPIVGWSIAVTQSEQDFVNEAARMRREILAVLGACIAAALIGAWLLSSGLTKTLRHAIEVVAKAGAKVNQESADIAVNAARLAEAASVQAGGIELTSSAITQLAATTKSNSIRAGAVAAIVRRADPKLREAHQRLEQKLDELNRQCGGNAFFTKLSGIISEAVNQEFEEVRGESRKVGTLIDEIAAACKEQATASQTVNNTISRFEQGVQAGAATAQQSAAAAVLLKAQVTEILHETAKLQRLIDGNRS